MIYHVVAIDDFGEENFLRDLTPIMWSNKADQAIVFQTEAEAIAAAGAASNAPPINGGKPVARPQMK